MAPMEELVSDQISYSPSEQYHVSEKETAGPSVEKVPPSSATSTQVHPTLVTRDDDAAIPPDGGYGWVVVVCQTTINAMTWGVNSAFAVYLSHFTGPDSAYFPGTTTLQYSFVGGVSVGVALAISPVASLLNNRYGFRLPMLLGSFIELLAFILASFARTYWELFMTQGILFGLSVGLLFSPSVGIPSQWFTKRRALASGICAGGSGLGGVMFSLSTNAMILNISLQWAYRITAIVVFVSTLTATLCTREFLARPTNRPNVLNSLIDHSVVRHAGYPWILAWGIMSLFGYVTLQFSISKYAVSAVGLSQTKASTLAALLSAGMAIGRPGLGFIADRVGRINAAIFFTLVSATFILAIWLPSKSYSPLIVFVLLEGTVAGTFWSSVIPVTAEIVGMNRLAPASNIIWLTMAVPCTFATTLALKIVGNSGDYDRLIIFAGLSYVSAGILLIGAKVRKQQVDGLANRFKIMRKT